jgi:hypothetical protein
VPDLNSLWKIKFNKELATCTNISIKLQHISSNQFLGLCYRYNRYGYYSIGYSKSPSTNHTEGNKLKYTFIYQLR